MEAYYLKDNVLPFNYAKSDNIPNEDDYIKENNLKVVEGRYPNLLSFININKDYTILEYKVDDILKLEKVTPANDLKKKVYKFNDDLVLDLLYLKNCIKILQLKDTINIEFYGEFRPVLIRNDKQEIGLLLPIN